VCHLRLERKACQQLVTLCCLHALHALNVCQVRLERDVLAAECDALVAVIRESAQCLLEAAKYEEARAVLLELQAAGMLCA
jgi:hypothetical protein